MKAAILKTFGQPLSIEEVAVPHPAEGEALVKVMASGLCATDIHIRDGIVPTVKLPHVPGHELAGIVEEVGPNTSRELIGKRIVAYIDVTCKKCRYCLSNRPNLCTSLVRIGFERDGSHQQYCVLPLENLIPIQEHIPFEQAAVAPDAVACMQHAIKNQGQVHAGQWVCFMGTGGIGLQGVQIAKHMGAKVIATARTQKRLDIALELGADYVVNTKNENLYEAVRDITNGDFCDVVFDLIGIEDSVDWAAHICSRGGKVILAAYTVPTFRVNYQEIVIREKELIGIRGATRQALEESMDLIGKGIITPFIYKTIPFDQINEGLQDVEDGKALGRIVVKPWE